VPRNTHTYTHLRHNIKYVKRKLNFMREKERKKNQIDASLVFSTTKFALERLKMKTKQNV